MSELELLRSLGEQIVPPSLDALRETARRRTRRTATVATAAAAAAVVAVIGAAQLVTVDRDSAPPPTAPAVDDTRPLTYAEGATLHLGGQAVTMPAEVVEIDLVDAGAVARTADGAVWFTDGSTPEQIGTIGAPAPAFSPEQPFYYGDGAGFVVSGNTGSLVGWLDFPQARQPQLVAYDTATAEEIAREPIELESGSIAVLTSVGAQAAFWAVDPVPYEDPAAVGRLDLSTGEQTTIHPTADGGPDTFEADPPPPGPRTILVSHREGGGPPYLADDGIGQQIGCCGAGGRLVPRGAEPLEVLDGGTREPFTFVPPPGHRHHEAIPGWLTQWIDDDTIVLGYIDDGGRQLADLLVCRISTHSCDVAATSLDAVLPEIG
jgi:hypothetical protein